MIPWASFNCEVVSTAKNGSEGYEYVIDNHPDIILTDVKMPIMDGLELIEKVRMLDKDVEFVVLSGYGEFELAQKAMRNGVKHYLLKPTNKAHLIQVIESVVEEIARKEDLHRKSMIQLNREYGVSFQKGLLLELLNTQSISSKTIRRYMNMINAKHVQDAYLLSLEDDRARQIGSPLVSDVQYLGKNGYFECLIGPMMCDEMLHAVVMIESMGKVESIREYLLSKKINIVRFDLADLDSTFLSLLYSVEGCKEIMLFDQHGHAESILNDFGFFRKIRAISENLARTIKQGKDAKEDFEELEKRMEGCTIEEMKSISFSLVTILQGEEIDQIDDHFLASIRNATTCEEILEGLKRLLYRQLSATVVDDSYPIKVITGYIEQNIASESVSLKWIAENLLGMNVGYLSKLFHKEVGLRFSDYLNRERINSAKRLMKVYHESTIQEIAQEVGFGKNPRYFSQVFKKYENETPSEYMASCKG